MERQRIVSLTSAVLLLACGGDPPGGTGATETDSASSSSGAASSGAPTATMSGGVGSSSSGGQADATGNPADPCLDDYHGNNSPQAALDLQLETSNTATITLGDAFVAGEPEVGEDQLVVCGSTSDFFTFEAICAGYLSVEIRRIDHPDPGDPSMVIEGEGPADLYLWDNGSATGIPLDVSAGIFGGFFLRPMHRTLSAGPHLIEVRPTLPDAMEYSLTVTVLPDCS